MSDLLERLRDQSRGGGSDAFEAAAEIERLREENAKLREANKILMEASMILRAALGHAP